MTISKETQIMNQDKKSFRHKLEDFLKTLKINEGESVYNFLESHSGRHLDGCYLERFEALCFFNYVISPLIDSNGSVGITINSNGYVIKIGKKILEKSVDFSEYQSEFEDFKDYIVDSLKESRTDDDYDDDGDYDDDEYSDIKPEMNIYFYRWSHYIRSFHDKSHKKEVELIDQIVEKYYEKLSEFIDESFIEGAIGHAFLVYTEENMFELDDLIYLLPPIEKEFCNEIINAYKEIKSQKSTLLGV